VHSEGHVSDVDPDPAGATTHPRLRVLLVIKCLGYGGAERLLVDMVAKGDTQSFEYEVAYVLAAEHALVPDIASAGVPVRCLEGRGNWDLRWMARLRGLILEGEFDVVHFHLPYTASLGRLAVATVPSAHRPAVVYTEHSLWNKMAVVIKGLNRATIGRDRALVVVSEAAHDALPDGLKDRARVIVHGVDLSRSDALIAQREEVRSDVRAELGVDDDDLLVMTVANLRPEKGYDVLLDSARLAFDRGLPLRFAAVGRGPLDDALKERHRQLGLDGRFQFLGQRHDVLRLLTGADIFVLASRQEGLPVSLMEATSVGVAIVATSVGGVPQVITDGVDGLIVPPGNPPALVDALERVASDPTLRRKLGDGAKGRSAMFDVTSASREVEGIYRQVAGAPR
jgi:glycosyltransferase involved in cell wall biosynthesis